MSNEPLDLNLLPEQHRGFQLRVWHIALALVALGLLISLVPNVQAFRKEQAATATVEKQLEQALQLLETLQIDQDELADINQRINETQVRLQRLQEEATVLKQQMDTRSPGIITAVVQRPDNVFLTRLEQGSQRLIVMGSTDSEFGVLDYARFLEASGRFVNVRIEVMESLTSSLPQPRVTFTIIAED